MSSLSSISNSSANNTLNNSSSNTTSGTSTGSSTDSSITGLSTSGISFQGLVSGLNTDSLIQGLLAPEQAIITDLQNQQSQITQQESAYNTLEANLTALQSSLSGLSSTSNNVFNSQTATSSNPDVATATTTSGAVPGQYSFTVNNLAQQQITSSQGFDSATSTITQGTFQFQVGSGSTQTVTINGSNDTLQGLATAINNLNAGVTASIVNDGSSSQSNHLMLTSTQSGTANAITITNNLAASSDGAMRPELNSTYVGNAVEGSGWTGTATPVSNSGSGNYTGTSNDTFTFTVTNGGAYNDPNTTISYTNSDGSITGTINGSQLSSNSFYTVANGIGLEFANGGNLVTGQSFSIKGFDPNTQAAKDASVTIGSGGSGLKVTSSSNQFQNLFPGLNVTAVSTSTSPVTLTVANDTQDAATSINNFVTAYNQVISYINQNDSYNSQTGQAGILLGDYHATSIADRLSDTATSAVSGVNSLANNLMSIGISVNSDGTLSVNSNTLNQALSGQLPGVSANDVRNLFAQNVVSSNSGVSYVYAPTTIQATSSPVQVQITQAATQGSVTGGTALANSTTIDNTNNTFSVSVDGQSTGTITLTNGTYTQSQLAQLVQTSINSQLGGPSVTASLDGNNDLVLSSDSYGSSSKVTIGGSGTALSALGLTASQTGAGQNVAGNFIYNGVVEAATGNGQYLTSNSSNKYTAGLEVQSTLTPAQVTSSPEGTLTISQGVAAKLNNLLTQMVDPISGQLTLANQEFQTQYTNIGQEITQQQQAMQQEQQQLLTDFTNMETVLAQLQSAGNALTDSLGGSTSTSSSSNNSSSTTL